MLQKSLIITVDFAADEKLLAKWQNQMAGEANDSAGLFSLLPWQVLMLLAQ